MKRHWTWASLAATVLGFGFSHWLLASLPRPKRAPVLAVINVLEAAAEIRSAKAPNNKAVDAGQVGELLQQAHTSALAADADDVFLTKTIDAALPGEPDQRFALARMALLLSIAKAQARAGDLPAAMKMASAINFDQPLPPSKGISRPWKISREEIDQQLRDAADGVPDGMPRFVHDALRHARAGDVAKARDVANAIKGDHGRDEALMAIAQIQISTKDFAGARQTTTMIKDYHGGRKSQIAVHHASVGDVAGALELAETMPGDWKDETLPHIAHEQAKAGAVRDALQTAGKISSDDDKPRAYALIALVQAKAGDIAGAQQSLDHALRSARQSSPKTQYWNDIAAAQAVLGQSQQTLESLNEMDNAAARDNALIRIVELRARAGDIPGAREMIAAIKILEFKVNAMVRLATVLAEAGNRDAARLEFNRARQAAPVTNANSPLSVAVAQAKSGDAEAALAWAAEQNSAFIRAYVLLSVAEGLLDRRRAQKS